MSIAVVEPKLLELLKLASMARPDEIEQYEALVGKKYDFEEVAVDFYNRPGVKLVILDGDTPIVAGGYDLIMPGVWQSWMIGTMDTWKTHWRTITKCTRRFMDGMLETERRLQTLVLASRVQTAEWYVRGLKMEYEGTLKGFGMNGEDADMYARIR